MPQKCFHCSFAKYAFFSNSLKHRLIWAWNLSAVYYYSHLSLRNFRVNGNTPIDFHPNQYAKLSPESAKTPGKGIPDHAAGKPHSTLAPQGACECARVCLCVCACHHGAVPDPHHPLKPTLQPHWSCRTFSSTHLAVKWSDKCSTLAQPGSGLALAISMRGAGGGRSKRKCSTCTGGYRGPKNMCHYARLPCEWREWRMDESSAISMPDRTFN